MTAKNGDKISKNIEDQITESGDGQTASSAMADLDIDALLEEAAKDFADEHELLSDNVSPDPDSPQTNVEDEARGIGSTGSVMDPSDLNEINQALSQSINSSTDSTDPQIDGQESGTIEDLPDVRVAEGPEDSDTEEMNDSESGVDDSLKNLEKELANLVEEVDRNIGNTAESGKNLPDATEPDAASEETPSPLTEDMQDDTPASSEGENSSDTDDQKTTKETTTGLDNLENELANLVNDAGPEISPDTDDQDASAEITNGLENLENELADLVGDIEAARPSPADDADLTETARSADTESEAPASGVDNGLNELEAELEKLGSLPEAPDGLMKDDTEAEVDEVKVAESGAERSSPTLETVSEKPSQESPITIAESELDSKVSEDQGIDVANASSAEKLDESFSYDSVAKIHVAAKPDPEPVVPTDALSEDNVDEDEFDSILSSYKGKHAVAVEETVEVQSSPEADSVGKAKKVAGRFSKIPLALLVDGLTLLDKPFQSLSKETKDMIGAAAVITSIMSIIAAIVLLYLQ